MYHQIRSVAQSCPTLCDPMNHSRPGLPVHHQLPEFTETQVHRISDAIQPSHTLSSPFFPAFKLSLLLIFPTSGKDLLRSQFPFIRWPKYWSSSFSISLSNIHRKYSDWFLLQLTGLISLLSKGLSRVFSNTTVQKHQFFGAQPSSQSNSHIHIWPQEKP